MKMGTAEGAEVRQPGSLLSAEGRGWEGGTGRLGREAEDSPAPPPRFCPMTAERTFSSNKQINLEKYDLS